MESHDAPTVPVNSVEDVLITSQLFSRPSRPPDFEAQNQALLELGDELRVNPDNVLNKVVELAMKLCNADSAGISILEPGEDRCIFRRHAITGDFAPNLLRSLPRDSSPCGTVLSLNRVLLFKEPDRFYPELRGASPHIYECLLAPWPTQDKPEGTLWVVAHSPLRHFDAEDARIVQVLARFAGAAHYMALALDRAKASQTDLEKRVEESAFLLSDTFKTLRKEMEEHDHADTGRKLAERALRETEHMAAVGRLSTSLAQQIDAPLDTVTNLLYLAEYATSLAEARKYLAQAQTEIIRAGQIAKASMSSDLDRAKAALADLGEIVESAISHHAVRITRGRIAVHRRFRQHSPLLCLPSEIRQAIANLVGNAVDAMKESEGRRLFIRVRPGADPRTGRRGVRITVADSGTGMPPGVQEHIFEPFFTAWDPPGAGLGLWVSREIVSNHRGMVQVCSAPGKGSTFVVFLPYLEPKEEEPCKSFQVGDPVPEQESATQD